MIYFDILQFVLFRRYNKLGFWTDHFCIIGNLFLFTLNIIALGEFTDFNYFEHFEGKSYRIPFLVILAFLEYYYWDEEKLANRMAKIDSRKAELENKLRVVVLYVVLSIILGLAAMAQVVYENY